MKTFLNTLFILVLAICLSVPVSADEENRKVSTFSEISLKVQGKLYVKQGSTQSVKIEAKSETLGKIITVVSNRKLDIKLPTKNYFWKNFKPGEIIIHVTVPDIDGLSISGSGDIVAENTIKSRILDLAVSGSGDIILDNLKAEKVRCAISGSGDITIEDGGIADEMSISISGSGNVKTLGFEANNVKVSVAGSGDSSVQANKSLKVRVAGSGNVYYKGDPAIDSSVAGSGRIKKL